MTSEIFKSLLVGDIIESRHSGTWIEIIEKQSSERYIACNGIAHFPVSFYDRDMYIAIANAGITKCTHKPAITPATSELTEDEEISGAKWVLTSPDGRIVDCAEMSESRAMGHNQTRANCGMSNRWESFDPSIHGVWSRVIAIVEALTDDSGSIDPSIFYALPLFVLFVGLRNAFRILSK
jgi:hypothetical protein